MSVAEGNLFRSSAWLYDYVHPRTLMNDVDMWKRYADRTGGPILELACGTGRISLPLARQGHEVWGIDLSEQMLDQFRKKLQTTDDAVRSRINLIDGDMTCFALPQEFEMILIAFSSFQVLTTREKQTDCLRCVHTHLETNGLFIVDVFRPFSRPLDESWSEGGCVEEEIVTDTGIKIRYGDVRRDIDVERQIIYPDLVYEVTHPDGREERVVEPLELVYFYEDQMRELLESCQFEIIEAFGDHDGGPIGEGRRLIFVCRKASRADRPA